MGPVAAGAVGGDVGGRADRVPGSCWPPGACVWGGGAVEAAAPVGGPDKTDARDARHRARLLHLGEIVEVRIPSVKVKQEAARDLVRAREEVRGDLMSARHHLSKLLLRQGIIYSGGKAWTGKHELWLRSHTFTTPGLQLAYDAAFDTMLAALDRRDRLDAAITQMAVHGPYTPVVTRLGCLRGVSTSTAFGLATEIGDWGPPLRRRLPWAGAHRVLLGLHPLPGRGHQRRQQPCPPTADRSRVASPNPVSAGA